MKIKNNYDLILSAVIDTKINSVNVKTRNSLTNTGFNFATSVYFSQNDHQLIDLYLDNSCLYHASYDAINDMKLFYGDCGMASMWMHRENLTLNDDGDKKIIQLPEVKKTNGKFLDLLTLRGSVREYRKNHLMSLEELSFILKYSFGFVGKKRVYASAGGFYPLDLYFYAINVQDLDSCIYKYLPAKNALELINQTNVIIKEMAVMENIDYANANLLAIFVWNSNMSRFKYGNSSLGFAFIECGEVAQLIELNAAQHNYGVCSLGGINKTYLANLIKTNDVYSAKIIHALIIGGKQ